MIRQGRCPLRELLIAVIDDDESFRLALVENLCSLGYGARGFASAEDFLSWETNASCDCVITDIHMPGLSGLDLARLLTARQPGVPVVMVTARSDLGIEERAEAGGAVCLLRKPFKMNALTDCIAKALKV
jgi:FixJ family two-component response regulator